MEWVFAAFGIIAFFVIIGYAISVAKRKSNVTSKTEKPNGGIMIETDKKLLMAAYDGDAEAQFKFAKACEFKDSGKYIYWLEKAAEQGHEEAIRTLAEEYDHGNNVTEPPIKKDKEKAVEYFTRLAEKGDAEAMKSISLIYFVEYKDEDKAREWTEKAANAGDIESMIELGDNYRLLADVEDFDKAEYWYKKAADAGSGEAMKGLGDLYCYDEKRFDYFKAESWYKKAVAAGDYFGYVRLDRKSVV